MAARSPGDDQRFSLWVKTNAVHTTARIGQAFFRAAVLSTYSAQCCITWWSMPKLVVASHIVPWRIDRLGSVNPRNGLLLSALHDKAFDIGLITIEDDMTVWVSRKHSVRNDRFFSDSIELYDGQPIRQPEKFRPDKELLAYHREHVFLDRREYRSTSNRKRVTGPAEGYAELADLGEALAFASV